MPDRITNFIESLDKKLKMKIKKALVDLKNSPYTMKNVRKLAGYENTYRLRIGEIRIVYYVVHNSVEVIDIDYRGNIY